MEAEKGHNLQLLEQENNRIMLICERYGERSMPKMTRIRSNGNHPGDQGMI